MITIVKEREIKVNKITISIKEDDNKILGLINEKFGTVLSSSKTKQLNGMDTFSIIAIPIATLTVDVIDFFLTHFAKQKNNNENKRVIITKSGKIDMTGYSADDVRLILESILESND